MRPRLRFDTETPAFERIAGRLRRATEEADRMVASLFAGTRVGPTFETRLEAIEAEIAEAATALTEHVRATQHSPMNENRRTGSRRRSA